MAEKGTLKKSVTKLKNKLINNIHNADLETLIEMAKQRGIEVPIYVLNKVEKFKQKE